MEPFWSWTHAEVILTSVGAVMVPFILVWLSDRKDRTRMHQQNQEKLDQLLEAEKYLPQHYHQEKDGPLHAEGIIRKQGGF